MSRDRKPAVRKRPIAFDRVSHATRAPFLLAASTRSASHGVTVSTRSPRMLKILRAFSNASGWPS